MTTVLPELWTDWCAATGVPMSHVDEPTLARFSQQARPPRVVLSRLRRIRDADRLSAPAWPRVHRDDPDTLHRLVRRADILIQHPATDWILRLRLRRMLFAAVLIAPPALGGLGLDQAGALGLRPDRLTRLRPRVGVAEDPSSCPSCAVWSWLEVLGTNSGWSHPIIRALAYRRDDSHAQHRHVRTDPAPDWKLSVGMLPAIDRWGYVDTYFSLHPSSLSGVISAMSLMLDGDDPKPTPLPEPQSRAPRREIPPKEEERILARADELNARVAQLLAEFT